jgi:hypothetical protein
MYQPLNKTSAVSAAHDWLAEHQLTVGPDGLVFAQPQDASFYDKVSIPEQLRSWLIGLRLMRGIPLAYLVPDAALFPAESIRFFHLDATWTDRVIDGVFSAANTGTLDTVFSYGLLASVRAAIDADLVALAQEQAPASTWTPDEQTTGMLIRSELVRRWPDMIVEAFSDLAGNEPIARLRAEPISRDVYIAIFAGVPKLVTVGEPHVGVRFGVEPVNENSSSPPYKVDRRLEGGQPGVGSIDIIFRNENRRVLNITKLADDIEPDVGGPPKEYANTRMVAIHLEQRAYVQEFKSNIGEPRGSIPLPPQESIPLRKGRVFSLAPLKARQAKLEG